MFNDSKINKWLNFIASELQCPTKKFVGLNKKGIENNRHVDIHFEFEGFIFSS